MRTLPKSKLIPVVIVVAAALLALPAAASATLTYTTGFQKPQVYIAKDNGKQARKIGPGRNSHVSPNGDWVAYERQTKNAAELRLYSVSTHKSRRLLNHWTESFVFAWSPDSTMLAATTGGLNGPQNLLVVDAENGHRVKVAKGYFNGVSFSPESDEIVYGMAHSENYPPKSNIYRYTIQSGARKMLSHNKASANPLWGPKGQIVFVRQLGAKKRKYGPKNELYVMNENGEQISQVTQTVVNPLAQGLTPVAWSENGRRLLAEFGGQDQGYAVAVNMVTGAQKALTKNAQFGLVGTALSPDGKTVLGTTGLGFGGNPHPKVVTVPFWGGKQKVLVKGAYEPSWGS